MIRVIVIIICFASVCIGLETTDVCHGERKTISCSNDSVIFIDSAHVGRMRVGNCVGIDYGYVGCSANVRPYLERKCSGRRSCLLEHGKHDPVLNRLDRGCLRELKTYLEVSHHCIQVETPPHNSDSSKCDGNIYPVGMATPNGYLARIVTTETGIGSVTCPWSIEARSGQTIRLTLYDFGVWQDSVATSTPGPGERPTCQVYATISERTGTAGARTMCGGVKVSQRQADGGRVMYTSNSSSVQVAVTTTNNSMLEQFLLKYEVVGCADPDPLPPLAHVERSFDRLLVKCIKDNNDRDLEPKAWTIQCLDDGNWSMPLSHINCSTPAGIVSEPICEERMPAEYNGILEEGSIVQMRCSLNFRGNLIPTMKWRQHGGSGEKDEQGRILTGLIETSVIVDTNINSALSIVIDAAHNGTFFTCKTYFQRDNASSQSFTATNAPEYSYTWNSSVIIFSAKNVVNDETTTDSTTLTSSTKSGPYIATIVVLSIVIVALAIAFCVFIGRKFKAGAAIIGAAQQSEETASESRSSNKYYEVNLFDQSTTATASLL